MGTPLLRRAALRGSTMALLVGMWMNVAAAPLHAAPRRALAGSSVGNLSVYVGYAEDKEFNAPNPASFPTPWAGSPNTTFLGNPVVGQSNCGALPSCYDAGAIRLDNTGSLDIPVNGVSVDDHSSISGGKVFNLWGSFTVPAGKSVILTQDPTGNNPGYANFDTSSYPNNNCTPLTVAPTVTITVNGAPTTLVDSSHVLDTGGIDRGYCAPARNESIQWRPIGASGADTASLTLSPGSTSQNAGQPVSVSATLLDGGGAGIPNTNVTFTVTVGPDAGRTGVALTDANGNARYTYTGSSSGSDTLIASVTTVGTFTSNQVSVDWVNGGPPPAPTQLSGLTVNDTTNAARWSLQTNLQAGVVQYGDRSYTIVSLPSALAGTAWIRTANASKSYAGNPTVSFTINQQAMVYVAVDTRQSALSWMDSSWIATGLTMTNSEAASSSQFALYGKLFPAGAVSLGPNSATGSTAYNMYSVIVGDGSGTSSPPPPPPSSTPTQLSGLTVDDATNASYWSLQTNIQAGATQYGDRSFTLVSVPALLAGAAWIRTANGSKTYTGTPTVSFTISQQATVYVAIDSRLAPPSWVDSSWSATGMTLSNSEASGSNQFTLYSKVFPAGVVALGPNSATGTTSSNMYSVIVP